MNKRESAINIEINNKRVKENDFPTRTLGNLVWEQEDYLQILNQSMSEKRWQHSLGVAKTAVKLAEHWNANTKKAWLGGLFHDYAREMAETKLLNLAKDYGLSILPEEKDNPIILHAPLSALLAKDKFGIVDEEILSAIRKHTVAGYPLSLLDKIIYLADLIEPGRSWSGVEKLRVLSYENIDLAMFKALTGTIEYLHGSDQKIHPATVHAWERLKEELQSRNNDLSKIPNTEAYE